MGCREGLPLPGIILIAPPGRGHLKQVTSCARARTNDNQSVRE